MFIFLLFIEMDMIAMQYEILFFKMRIYYLYHKFKLKKEILLEFSVNFYF